MADVFPFNDIKTVKWYFSYQNFICWSFYFTNNLPNNRKEVLRHLETEFITGSMLLYCLMTITSTVFHLFQCSSFKITTSTLNLPNSPCREVEAAIISFFLHSYIKRSLYVEASNILFTFMHLFIDISRHTH